MLLNEFLKEHRNVAEQQNTIAELETTVAQQQKRIASQQATAAQQQKADSSAHRHGAKSQRASRAKGICSANNSERRLRLRLPGL
jgi:hypothetical protein